MMAYMDDTTKSLKLAACADATCSAGATVNTLDSGSQVGYYASLALSSTGTPVVGYYDATLKDLKLAACPEPTCTLAPILRTVDSDGNVGMYLSLVLTDTGLPIFSYYDGTAHDLKLAVCVDRTCTTNTVFRTIDSDGIVGRFTSMVLTAAGLPVISYFDDTNTALKLALCADATCSANAAVLFIDQDGTVGQYSVVTLAPGDIPIISYYDNSNGRLKLAICRDAACSGRPTIQTLATTNALEQYSSLAVVARSLIVSYWHQGLRLAVCDDAVCSSSTSHMIDAVDAGPQSSLVMAHLGTRAVVAYSGANGNSLKLATYTLPFVPPPYRRTQVLDSNNGATPYSLAMTREGVPVLAYVRLAICTDPTCMFNVVRDIDPTGNLAYPSLALNPQGHAVVLYQSTNGNLKLAVCLDVLCTTTKIRVVSSSARTSFALAVTSAGHPVATFFPSGNSDATIRLARCSDPLCSSSPSSTYLTAVGSYLTMALRADDVPVIVYMDSKAILRVALCADASCSSGTTVVKELNGCCALPGFALALTSTGHPVVAFSDILKRETRLLVCSDAGCSDQNVTTIARETDSRPLSMVLRSNDLPIISFRNYTLQVLQHVVCFDKACVGRNFSLLTDKASSASLGAKYISLALSPADTPVIAYQMPENNTIQPRLAMCRDAQCLRVNECVDGTHNCSLNAQCADTADSYTCTCNTGYTGDGVVCTTWAYRHDSRLWDQSTLVTAAGNVVIAGRVGTSFAVVACSDSMCTSNTTRTLAEDGIRKSRPSVALTAADAPVFAYVDLDDIISVCVCADTICTFSTCQSVDATSGTGTDSKGYGRVAAPSVAVTAAGLPILSYHHVAEGVLKLIVCSDYACVGLNTYTVDADASNYVGQGSQLQLSPAGNPIIVYRTAPGDAPTLKLAVCSDLTCSPGGTTIRTLSDAPTTSVSMVLTAAGNPLLAYRNNTGYGFYACHDPKCNTKTLRIVFVAINNTGWTPALALSADGNPIMAWTSMSPDFVFRLLLCHDSSCSDYSVRIIEDSDRFIFPPTNLAVTPAGLPVITYFTNTPHVATPRITVALCADPLCTP